MWSILSSIMISYIICMHYKPPFQESSTQYLEQQALALMMEVLQGLSFRDLLPILEQHTIRFMYVKITFTFWMMKI